MKMQLVVVAAFDLDDNGELLPAFEPRELPSIDRAKMAALELSEHHDGVVAWSREADPDLGEYGPPVMIASYGLVPEME